MMRSSLPEIKIRAKWDVKRTNHSIQTLKNTPFQAYFLPHCTDTFPRGIYICLAQIFAFALSVCLSVCLSIGLLQKICSFVQKNQGRQTHTEVEMVFGWFFFFHPADPEGISQGGLPGIPTQLWHLLHRRGAKGFSEHRFRAPLPPAGYTATQLQPCINTEARTSIGRLIKYGRL